MIEELEKNYPRWILWLITFVIGLGIASVLILAQGCNGSVKRWFDPNSGKVVREEYKGGAADTVATTQSELMKQNARLNATAKQTTTYFCWTLYGTGVLFIIGGIALAWLYSKKTGIGVVATGIGLFLLARMLQQYLTVIVIATLVVCLLMVAWYIYKYHDTILKIAPIQIKEIK